MNVPHRLMYFIKLGLLGHRIRRYGFMELFVALLEKKFHGIWVLRFQLLKR